MSSGEELPAGLYLIATPIGNLGDVSQRAIKTMSDVNRLYAEDTRHSRKLLNHLGIDRGLLACHEHNEAALTEEICRMISNGDSCGLISDAGTPGISDPGFRLVRACRKAGLPVIPIPGASAVVTALSVSGLPTDSFLFVGFLPPKRAARLRHFEENKEVQTTLVYFESTHRIEKFITDAETVFGPDRVICIARELTKHHETVLTGPLQEVASRFAKGSSKGEYVVMVAKEGYTL
ncbi:16S rRNA (cytidine(1402)-2'-O)-methyltransferase [Puniceicoccales bacterium CK1056]|uniref:Ribosomal RNA small subunit methyltransferase I n=1 Tax=Oceanipulchritudo coccoides TaxID=2706888 RepID=A0A6B2M6P3_9BACT|nr:16S rRNA (cytidine(1402)-2'-O)-methyltransferase [Oceanipulchritudo coccoides]NDV63330.1 16S rRNA (cytidine(1402)-2'-O)-methyltransferase [Oceanipulchritudo coccoides]